MKVVVDDKIPYIRGQVERMADEVVYLPGSEIKAEDVRDADALIIRTRTRCNRALLAGSRVKFIATATIGFDHLDTDYLAAAGIAWSNCPGCNANSVAQYIHSSLLLLQRDFHLDLEHTTLGIVGLGHVGQAVAKAVLPLGVRILANDPPRAEKENNPNFCSLQQLQEECDIISFHTPLTKTPPYPTFHLADTAFFNHLSRTPIIINSGRGEVVNNLSLLQALDSGKIKQAIIDTWENEPNIDTALLNKVYIGTPHIAGYSADGKANATRMSLEALNNFWGLNLHFTIEAPSLPDNFSPATDEKELALQLYNPLTDSERLKAAPEHFEMLRGNYPLRREHL